MSDDEKIAAVLSRPTREAEKLAKDENILLHPLAGWVKATLPQNYVMLGIEYLTQPPTIEARILRLAMTRAQAAELSKELDQLARTPHVEPPEKPS